MSQPTDSVVRAITDDGAFRVIVASTTATVRGAIAAQQARGPTAERFGDLLTGTALCRETMAPQFRMQGILRGGDGRGRLVADAYPDGANRGLVQLSEGTTEVTLGKGALLEMMRTLPNGAVHQGVVDVGERAGLSDALMAYLQTSEQVASMLAVATVIEHGEVVVAGGYLVQLLPEVGQGPLMVMAERLADFASIYELLRAQRPTPDALLGELLYGMAYTRLEESPLRFACRCSQERVVQTLATLSRADLEELLGVGEALEVGCEYCGRKYAVSLAELRALLDPN